MTLGIQFGGLASGLNTGAIIDAILAVEGRALRVLEGRTDTEERKLSLIGAFEGLVNKLRDQARELQTGSNFFAHKLTVGEEGIATFTLAGNAAAGSHQLEVLSLAAADRFAFAGVIDPDASLGSGNVSFSYDGVDYDVTVAAGADTLNNISDAINATAGDAVTASVVNVGTEATPSYQLVIAGDDTGIDFTVTNLSSSVAGLTGQTQISFASNAQVNIDGLVVERSNNLFSNVMPGVSFTVSRTNVGAPMSFTVDLDPSGIKENIQGFVDAYNGVMEFINSQNTFTLEGGTGGPLFGDNALSTIGTNLRRALFNPDPTVLESDGDFGSMGRLGIELQGDGTLSIDSARLEERLSGDLDAFEDFFNRADDMLTSSVDERGVFVKLEEILDNLTKDRTALDGESTIEGLFKARRSSINRQIKDFGSQAERLEFRLEKLEESLVAKFASLEQLLGGLQAQQAFLSASIGASNK
jgi:flagellar hook-associated protein 2